MHVTDADGDALTYTLQKGPEGMTIDPATGVITWNIGPDVSGDHEIEVLINDDHGAEILVPFTTKISNKELQ